MTQATLKLRRLLAARLVDEVNRHRGWNTARNTEGPGLPGEVGGLEEAFVFVASQGVGAQASLEEMRARTKPSPSSDAERIARLGWGCASCPMW